DDGPLTEAALPRWLASLFDADLKALGLLAPVAIAHPDEIVTGRGDFDRLRQSRLVVVGAAGDREEAALAALVPLRGPAGAGEAEVAVRLLHLWLAHRPAVAAQAVHVLGLEPDRLWRRLGRWDAREQGKQ